MKITKKLFNQPVSVPVSPTYTRITKYDGDGNEVIAFEKARFSSLGTIDDWSLENQIRAGVPINSSVHTSGNSRLDSFPSLGLFTAQADVILSEVSSEKESQDN